MTAWIVILIIVTVIIPVVLAIVTEDGVAFIFCLTAVFILFPVLGGIECISDAEVFVQQKAYIETYEPDDAIENAALTNKKIELNDWLFHAQWSKGKFGVFSIYPDGVLELEPIN